MLLILLITTPPTNNPKLVFSFTSQTDQLLIFSTATTTRRRRLRRRRLSSSGASGAVVVEATGRRRNWWNNSNTWSDDQDKQQQQEEEDISEGGNRRGRPWWSDALQDQEEEADEDYVDDDDDDNFMFSDEQSETDVWWKNIWFLKVLSSYGWFLPPIIISMLVATGPKAFLMAMAFPLGQSVISYAIDKYWLKARAGPKPPKSKSPRKANFRTSPAAAGNDGRSSSWKTRNRAVGEKNDRPKRRTTSSRSSEVRTSTAGRRFGGSEELVDDDERPPSSSYPRAASCNINPSPASGASGSAVLPHKKTKGAVVRRGRNRDTPLFIRLLVAIFPFLGSWVKIL